VKSSGGCANITVNGSNFVPTTDPTNPNTAYLAVFASTNFSAFATIYPTIDSSGNFSTIFQVCGLGAPHILLEIGVEDDTSYLYGNMMYTVSD
jgi:hypothetical protein